MKTLALALIASFALAAAPAADAKGKGGHKGKTTTSKNFPSKAPKTK